MNPGSNTDLFYSNGYVKAIKFFKDKKLDVPFILKKEKGKIDEVQPEVFGTRDCPTTIYDLNSFLEEVLSSKVEDYVLFGAGGHGVSSRAIHYYAVYQHLALFIQLGDGIYKDESEKRDRINGTFYAIEYLYDAIAAADKNGLIPDGQRLLVIDSDFYGRGWEWIHENQGSIDPQTWNAEEGMLQAMLAIPSES
jgi:hypothetical protein